MTEHAPAPKSSKGPSIDEQREFYDGRWARHTYANWLKLQRTVAILEGLAKTRRTEPTILEVGCGTGWLSEILGQFGPTTGIDLSPHAIDLARRRYPHVTFLSDDVSSSQLHGTFDVVVSHEVIEHLEDQPGHIAQLASWLRPGGHLILTTPNGYFQDDGGQMIENHVSARELRRLLRSHFTILEQRSLILSGWRKRFPRLLKYNFGKHLFVLAEKRC